jgi:hypothetical protein
MWLLRVSGKARLDGTIQLSLVADTVSFLSQGYWGQKNEAIGEFHLP